jgi:hypothetical protein
MDSGIEYMIDYYQEKSVCKTVFVVLLYSDDTLLSVNVYADKRLAEEEAGRSTGSGFIVPAGKDVEAISYAIGEELFAEIHEKPLRLS